MSADRSQRGPTRPRRPDIDELVQPLEVPHADGRDPLEPIYELLAVLEETHRQVVPVLRVLIAAAGDDVQADELNDALLLMPPSLLVLALTAQATIIASACQERDGFAVYVDELLASLETTIDEETTGE